MSTDDSQDVNASENADSETDADAVGVSNNVESTTAEDSGSGTDGNQSGAELSTRVINPDVAPRTFDEVKAYLNVGDRVVISEVDIHLAANEIAVLNGYKDLDYQVYTGDDPDWIFPERILHMPGTGDYVIKRGDTIWFLAAREVRVDVEQGIEMYDKALAILDNSGSDADARMNAEDILRDIAEGSKAAAMRVMARNALSTRQL